MTGNDGSDQLIKFNKALYSLSSNLNKETGFNSKGREIDGVLLSKFDTVDEKVGAAISLCHLSKKPILFVGTG